MHKDKYRKRGGEELLSCEKLTDWPTVSSFDSAAYPCGKNRGVAHYPLEEV
jgi:hypothetical protein